MLFCIVLQYWFTKIHLNKTKKTSCKNIVEISLSKINDLSVFLLRMSAMADTYTHISESGSTAPNCILLLATSRGYLVLGKRMQRRHLRKSHIITFTVIIVISD